MPSANKVIKFERPMPARQRLVCSGCGAPGKGSCDCGVTYVPAGALAADAIANNPTKSDRSIAEEIGVSTPTVSRARKKSTVTNVTVEKRTGKDGKARKMPKKPETVVIGGLPLSPTKAKQVERANAKLSTMAMRDQINSFIKQLTTFEDDFTLRLVAWREVNPKIEADGQHALVLFLSQCSMRFQKLAQQIDGR